MSDKTTPQNPLRDLEALIADFQTAGMQELHLRANGVEIYLSRDSHAAGLDASPAAAAKPAPAVPSAAGSAPVAPSAGATAAGTAPSAAQPVPAGGAPTIPDGATVVRAPYLGTFYRSPKPGAERYVEIGSDVGPDTDLCLVEVMKLFTAVRAGITGKVSAILAEDGQMVEAGQPLFAIEATA